MEPLLIIALLLLLVILSACVGLLILQVGLQRVFSVAPQLEPLSNTPITRTSLTVVIPVYNESANICPCLLSVLRSESPCSD